LTFLLYFGLWTFAVNLSSPFFNLYMLDNLHLDVSLVTLYGSLTAGANLLMLVIWGKLADRIGNRPMLVFIGILGAVMPLLWLGTGANSPSVWVWLPLVHLLTGGTWAAIDLCNNNIQMSVAPRRSQAIYFAIASAIAGVTGALGTTTGGFLAQLTSTGGLTGLFAISAVLRLVALLPLVFVREPRSLSLMKLVGSLNLLSKKELLFSKLPAIVKPQAILIQSVVLTNRSK
jgi:MFS family permease